MSPPGRPLDWELVFRLAEQRLKLRKWEIGRYTLSQLCNALDFSDPNDPHAGQTPITSLEELANY